MFHAVIYVLLSLAYLGHADPQLVPERLHHWIPWLPVVCYALLAMLAVAEGPRVRGWIRRRRQTAARPNNEFHGKPS